MNSEKRLKTRILTSLILSGILPIHALAQDIAADNDEEKIITLSPFIVDSSVDRGYMATSSLAGTRLRTNLKDIGASVSAITGEMMDDLGATDVQDLLSYTANFEVGGANGNYLGAGTSSHGSAQETGQQFSPSTTTRVRGLVSADNTRNYFRSTVGWDSYNVRRVDLLRGPNSILFGLGSPGGVVNGTVDSADLRKNSGEVKFVFDQFGSIRSSVNINKVILKDQLAIRFAALRDDKNFRQKPAYEDEERYFLAAKYRPSYLNSRTTSFEISVDYEEGKSRSNRPRYGTPLDQFSAFIQPVVLNPIQLPAGSNWMGYEGGLIPGGTYSLDGYTKENFFDASPAGVINSFDGNGLRHTYSSAGDYWSPGRSSAYGVLQSNGNIYTGAPASANARFGNGYLSSIVGGIQNYAAAIDHPFASYFRGQAISDPSIFDFYNTLIDGDNKREWQDFDQLRLSLSNTFLNNKLGYEISYYKENNKLGQYNLMSVNSRIFIDIDEKTIEGTPNPDLGRAFIQETTNAGNRTQNNELDAFRASAYYDHDFRDSKGAGWLRTLLGRHIVNAVYSEDTVLEDNRTVAAYIYGEDLLEKTGWGTAQTFNANNRVTMRYYISDDLRNATTTSGLNFSNLAQNLTPQSTSVDVRYFDNTWNADPSVSPNANWTTPQGFTWKQATNPANYVGWTNDTYDIVSAFSGNQADFDKATYAASLQQNKVESQVLSWQGYLFDGIFVGTYGYRKDKSVSLRRDGERRADGGDDVSPESYNLGLGTSANLEVESYNLSGVLHLNQIPVFKRLPINVSLTYNKGENFDPSSARLSPLGNPIDAPQGSTKEYGIALSTKDNRYSMRLQQYETSVLNGSGPGIPNDSRFQQFFGRGADGAYQAISGELRDEIGSTPTSWSIDDVENIYAPAWRQFEQDFAAEFPTFVDFWKTQGTWGPGDGNTVFEKPSGVVTTGDTLSKGYELEFVANPTDNLRLSLNASKTEATVDNIPGQDFAEVYSYIHSALWNGTEPTAVGKIRDGISPSLLTIGEFWLENVWSNYSTVLDQNGQIRGEVVEYRVNAVGNYTFREGPLKGLGIGGAYRWESGATIGYPKMFDEFGFIKTDLEHPFVSDAKDRVDLTISYRKKLSAKIDWTIQLNLYNTFGENEVLPVGVNPDGSIYRYRIQEGRSWRISNTFRF